MLAALHELLVDDLAGIHFACSDMDGLLDDGIGAAAKGLACAVLWRVRRVELGGLSGSYLAGDCGGRHDGGGLRRCRRLRTRCDST